MRIYGRVVLLSAFFIAGFTAYGAGPNLIQNGDFELASSNPAVPQNWSGDSWGTIAATFTYPAPGKDATRGAKVQVTSRSSGDAKWMHNHVPVSTSTYQFKDEYSSNVVTNVTVEFLMQNGTYNYVWLGNPPSTGGAWSSFSATVDVPTGAKSLSVLHIIDKVGTLTIDNTTLEAQGTTLPPPPPPPPPPSGNNLVQNGTLESGGSTPTGWSSNKWGTLTATFTYPATGKTGRGAKVQVTSRSSGDAKWSFNHIPITAGTLYRWSEDYSANVISNVSIEYRMQNGSYQYQWLSDAPATGSSWGKATADITPPTGAASFSILHSLVRNGVLTIDNATVTALSGGAFGQGMVTFVFDDALASQFANGRPILNTAGVKGVFAVITQYAGSSPYMTWANLTTLKNEGHEIASHTRTHPNLSTLSSSAAQGEITGSMSDLVARGLTPKTLVYPLGGTNVAVQTQVQNAGYLGARGSYFGLNTPVTNKYALYDIRADKSTSVAYLKGWIDQAASERRWLVFELHDILASGGDEYTITPTTLKSLVDYAKQKNVRIVTLEEGIALMGQ